MPSILELLLGQYRGEGREAERPYPGMVRTGDVPWEEYLRQELGGSLPFDVALDLIGRVSGGTSPDTGFDEALGRIGRPSSYAPAGSTYLSPYQQPSSLPVTRPEPQLPIVRITDSPISPLEHQNRLREEAMINLLRDSQQPYVRGKTTNIVPRDYSVR